MYTEVYGFPVDYHVENSRLADAKAFFEEWQYAPIHYDL